MKELLRIMRGELMVMIFLPFYVSFDFCSIIKKHEKPEHGFFIIRVISLPIYWAICAVIFRAIFMFLCFVLNSF